MVAAVEVTPAATKPVGTAGAAGSIVTASAVDFALNTLLDAFASTWNEWAEPGRSPVSEIDGTVDQFK